MCNSTEDGGRLSTDYDNDEFEGLPPDSGQSNLEEPFPALPASTSDEDKERSGDDITSAIHDDKLEIVKKLLQEDHDLIKKEFDYTFNEDDPEESWTSRGMTPLAFAARLDRFEISKFLLEEGADVFAKTKSNGTNTFWLAVLHEHLELADILLDRGTKSLLEFRSDFGDTALIRFAFLGELKLVAYLLGKEADITAMEDESGDTALHVAAIEGHFEVVQMLWNARPAEIDILELRNKSGQTPLLAAAQCNQSEITKFLLDKGAKYDVQDNDGNTPLHYAAMTNDLELAQRLPKNEERSSESPDQLNADNKSKYSTILNRQNKNQDTPIVLTASSEQTSVFDFLLKSGANLNVRVKNGDTVLHRAAQTGNLDIVKKLLPAPAENPCPLKVQGNDPSTHQKGNGTTDFATSLGNFDLLKNHLGSTGNEQLQHVKNMLGQTPMMLAAQEEMFEVVEYLLGKNETFTSKGMNLEKAMLSSAENGYIRLIQGLWEVSDLREIQDSSGRTPLLIASDEGHAKIVEYLCQNGAKLGVKDDAGYTPILNAVWRDSVAMVKCLLNHGADQAATGTLGMNALHQACRMKGRSEILRILLADSPERLRKALSTKDMDGNTPLCDALGMAESAVEDSKIFQLLGSKVYFPLNPAQDCVHNSPEGERERVGTWLKNWIQKRRAERMQRKEREERERRPENEQSRGYPKPPRSQPDQQKQPDQNYNPNQKEENERIKSIIYWAILNNDEELMKLAMTEGGYPTLKYDERRKSVTWLHVAALGNCPDIVSGIRDWETLIQAKTERDITPLHIAARMGHNSILRKLLWNLSGLDQGKLLKDLAADNMVNVLHAIIHETKDDDNLISLIVAKQEEDNIASRDTKHRDKRHAFKNPKSSVQSKSYRKSSEEEKSAHEKGLVSELWETVIAIIQAKSQIFLGPPYSLDVEFIIKSVVSMHAIMEKRHFSIITSLMIAGHTDKKGDKLEASTSNILEWTARYEFSLAFCWLLSSGDYFGEDHIKSCENAIKPSVSGNKKHNGRLIIEALLQNPPPIRTRKGDTKAPEFLYSIPYDETRMGTVIEISRTEKQIYHNLNLKRSEIFEFVYDGPETPMKNDDTYTCKAIIEKLRSAQLEIETNQAQGDSEIKKDAKPKGRERAGIQSSQEKVRWLHIPVNDLRFVQELMVQVSRERGRDNNFYRSLIEFCQGSMLELAAGDGNHYMMPHFQSARNSTTEKNERSKGDLNVLGEKKNFDGVALYMPYLYWGVKPDREQENSSSQFILNQDSSEEEKIKQSFGFKNYLHGSLTLDEYYYAALGNIDERDDDQVVGRYFAKQLELKQEPEPKDENKSPPARPILLVNQLWLWIIDDETIITSTTAVSESEETTTFVQRVIKELRKENGNSVPKAMRVAEVIRDTATNLFDAKEIEFLRSGKKSPLDIFRESIQEIRNEETKLLKEFRKSIGSLPAKRGEHSETSKNPSPPQSNLSNQPPPWARFKMGLKFLKDGAKNHEENPYENIVQETSLLVLVNDILDELNILQTLVRDQQHVYSLWKGPREKTQVEGDYSSVDERDAVIVEMIRDAQSLQDAINKLLDLKQKQATIMEAQATRRQSDSVMVFTVVTVVFLPASFLASLFALDIAEFPHVNGGVVFQGRWIFPIIFGVAFAFALVFLPLAFKANLFKNIFKLWRYKREPGSDEESGGPAKGSSYEAPSTGEQTHRSSGGSGRQS